MNFMLATVMVDAWSLQLLQISKMYHSAVGKVRESGDWAKVRPAFTCDLWRSQMQREYFTLTMHWIEVTTKPDGNANCQWNLRKRILGAVPVEAESVNHEGAVSLAYSAVFHFVSSTLHVFCFV